MTYAELITRTQTVLRRTDDANKATIELGLAMAHDEIQLIPEHDWHCQEKRTAEDELIYAAADALDGIALPTDFMRHRDLWFDQSGHFTPVTFLDANAVREKEAKIARGEETRPQVSTFWRILNGKLVLWPDYSATLEQPLRLDYYAKLEFYADNDESDWFSINAPNALVFGAAWLVCLNIWQDERAATFSQTYQGFLAKAVALDDRNAGGPRRAYTPEREYFVRRGGE